MLAHDDLANRLGVSADELAYGIVLVFFNFKHEGIDSLSIARQEFFQQLRKTT